MDRKLSREDLIRLVEKIRHCEGTEEEVDEMIALLERSVPHPEVTGLIFWSKQRLTSEQIVDGALSYKRIILPERMPRPGEDER